MMILMRIVEIFIIVSSIEGNIYLYFTEDSSSIEYYDCIFHLSFVYCLRPVEPISLYRENSTLECDHNGTRHSFFSIWSKNISVNTVLHHWRSTLEMAGRYARYKKQLIKSNDDNEQYLCQCNNNPQSFGKHCEYLLPIGTTFPETVDGEIEMKKNNVEKAEIHSDIMCYRSLECDSGLLCLDWRDICDGIQQCMFGYDEENCDKLEFNECENDEYRCMNGMCIPNEYFVDGEYDCMDLTDEKGDVDNKICALQQASLECDERLCPPNEWSCGDGQCISDRLAFQASPIISPTCISRRDQYFMCETHETKRMWTMQNGKCYTYDNYEEENTDNRSLIEECIYFIKCALSEGLEKNCRSKMNDSKKACSNDDIQYPNGAIIAPYVSVFFVKSRDWNKKVPDYMKINASIKCRGYVINYENQGSYRPKFIFREFEHKACSSKSDDYVLNEYCYNNSRTFNNRSYNFIDVCQESRECISAYRIRDGFTNCDDGFDELDSNTCLEMKRHRFQCSSTNEPTCLSVSQLGDLNFDCKNKHDESWMGTDTTLAKMNCKIKAKHDCELIRQYIEASWNIDYNSSLQVNPTKIIPFRSYCDTFWDFSSKVDENAKLCRVWWICPDNQWQCGTGQCIDKEWVLDGEWDCSDASDEEAIFIDSNQEFLSRNFKLLDRLYLNETRYRNRPLMNLCNPEKEFPCYRMNSSYPLTNLNNSRPCISLEKLGDGHIDCLGGLDEQNTLDFCHRSTMLGRNFKCFTSDVCISYSAMCKTRCPNATDDNVLCDNRNRLPHCSNSSTADFACFNDQCKKGGWCKDGSQCTYGEDEYFCNDPTKISNSIHRREKEISIRYKHQLFQLPHFPISTNETKSLDTSSSTTPRPIIKSNLSEIESSLISYVCNRGIGVFTPNNSIVCFCPQQYYGDRCQFYNDRITFIFHMNFSQSIYTSSDSTVLLKMIVLFMFENQTLSSYEFHARPAVELTSFYKKIDHVVYSRSNQSLYYKRERYFNRSNIIDEHPYSVRIEAYHIKIAQEAQLTAVWQYPIYFDFLPAFRFAKVLYLTKPQITGNPCTSNPCNKYQECHQLLNDKKNYICLCKDNYRGDNCSELDPMCSKGFCLVNSLCKPTYRGLLNRIELPYCICPRYTFGFQCDLEQDQCDSKPCQNNGTCFQSATPGSFFCVCNSLYQGDRCEFDKEAIRLYINQSIEHRGAVVQYFFIDFSNLKLILDHQHPYEKLPDSLFYRHSGKTAPEIIVVKVYSQMPREIHLISVHTDVSSINGTTEITENNRCLNINADTSPFKYHHLCRSNQTLLCFYDLNYLCICDENHSRVDCFGYDHSLDYCSHCIAGGRCLKGDDNDYICVCPLCHSGRFCQFSSESFSFTLDQLFSADLLSNNRTLRHATIYLLIIGSSIMFLLGLVNNIFAFVTFRRRKCRRNGTGQYLLFMSIINQINLGLFTLRLIHLTINIISRPFHSLVNVILCSGLNYLLITSSRITYWLVSLIAIERVYTILFLNKRWLRKPYVARRLIILTSMSILITGAYELVFVTSHSGFNDGKSAICVLEFPLHRPIWKYIHQSVTIINALLPFLINLCCMITIICVVVKKKMAVNKHNVYSIRRSSVVRIRENSTIKDQNPIRRQSRFYLLYEVLNENKELIIGPAFTLVPQLFSLPLFIASILLVCQTIETNPIRYLLIMSYFTSFIPQLISFFLYISPSTLYYNEWCATNWSKRIKDFKLCCRRNLINRN